MFSRYEGRLIPPVKIQRWRLRMKPQSQFRGRRDYQLKKSPTFLYSISLSISSPKAFGNFSSRQWTSYRGVFATEPNGFHRPYFAEKVELLNPIDHLFCTTTFTEIFDFAGEDLSASFIKMSNHDWYDHFHLNGNFSSLSARNWELIDHVYVSPRSFVSSHARE
jgi:hypothetical protein